MRKIASLFTLLAIASLQFPALAWNRAGHMVSGAIAYSELKQNAPRTIPKVIALLKQHPDFKTRWEPQLNQVAASDRDLYLFMLAARWSDDARDEPKFDHPTWHYINFPYQPSSPSTETPTEEPGEENILTAFKQNREIVQSRSKNPERAVALCWMFHLIGDVHQPLHTTKLITTQFPLPEGDRGGTRFYIRVKPNSQTISLHKFWDDLILGSEQFKSVQNRATELRLNRAYRRAALSELAETEFDHWAEVESFTLAKQQAYQNGTLKGSSDPENGEVLPQGYAKSMQAIAERRVVLAGYRLADSLKQLFAK